MKLHVGWLFPELVTHRTDTHRVLDISLRTIFAYEYLDYDGGSAWYLVVQLFGFGICVNVLREIT